MELHILNPCFFFRRAIYWPRFELTIPVMLQSSWCIRTEWLYVEMYALGRMAERGNKNHKHKQTSSVSMSTHIYMLRINRNVNVHTLTPACDRPSSINSSYSWVVCGEYVFFGKLGIISDFFPSNHASVASFFQAELAKHTEGSFRVQSHWRGFMCIQCTFAIAIIAYDEIVNF